jgi:type IV secretion system protein VirB8
VTEEPREEYFERAISWSTDRELAQRRSFQLAWWIAGAATLVAILEALALTALVPLKSVTTRTLLVDRHTGHVQSLDDSERGIKPDEALTQSFLVQYVTAREGLDLATLSVEYRKVALWSADRARASYLAQIPATNPESPLNRYPRGTIVRPHVKSVSFSEPGSAMVRFQTERVEPNGGAAVIQDWVALIRYRFSGAPMAAEDRFINPLGFQVLSYRLDAESLPASKPNTAAPAVLVPVARGSAPAPVPAVPSGATSGLSQ